MLEGSSGSISSEFRKSYCLYYLSHYKEKGEILHCTRVYNSIGNIWSIPCHITLSSSVITGDDGIILEDSIPPNLMSHLPDVQVSRIWTRHSAPDSRFQSNSCHVIIICYQQSEDHALLQHPSTFNVTSVQISRIQILEQSMSYNIIIYVISRSLDSTLPI